MLRLKKKTFDVESTGTRVAADEAAVVARKIVEEAMQHDR